MTVSLPSRESAAERLATASQATLDRLSQASGVVRERLAQVDWAAHADQAATATRRAAKATGRVLAADWGAHLRDTDARVRPFVADVIAIVVCGLWLIGTLAVRAERAVAAWVNRTSERLGALHVEALGLTQEPQEQASAPAEAPAPISIPAAEFLAAGGCSEAEIEAILAPPARRPARRRRSAAA